MLAGAPLTQEQLELYKKNQNLVKKDPAQEAGGWSSSGPINQRVTMGTSIPASVSQVFQQGTPNSPTAKSFAEAQSMLGPGINTAVLERPTLDASLNPTPITHGETVEAKEAQLRNAADLAAQYGNITYDRQAIEDIFKGATEAEYAAKEKAYDRSAGQFYNRLGQSSLSYLDAMRKANAGAVQSGANTGVQNANALSALLGMSQQSSADATKLAQDARGLADQKAAALSKNTADALTLANQTGLSLGQLASGMYGIDAQQYAAQLGHNAQIGAANLAADAQAYASDRGLQGTEYNALANLLGQKYASDSNFNSNVYGSQSNLYGSMYGSNKNLEGSKYAADQNLKGAQAQASATKAAAGAAAAATKYAANQNYNAQVAANNAMLKNTMLQISTANPTAKDVETFNLVFNEMFP